MGRLNGVDWRAPASAVASLLAGAAFALGHHFFYQSLDGRALQPTHEIKIGSLSGLSPQRFNISVGTLLAFLAKACLCLAVGIAYVQVMWKDLKAHSVKISTADSASALTNNLLAFFNFTVWRRYPLLILLGVILWITPLAAVITPSTLSVETQAELRTVMRNVSNVDFTSLNFANLPNLVGLSSSYSYAGPQFAVSKVAIASAAQGRVLAMGAPNGAPNATYEQTFSGPALRCDEVTRETEQNIIESIRKASDADSCSVSYGYLSWTPDPGSRITPFVSPNNGSLRTRGGSLGPIGNSYDDGIPPPLSIYVASLPSMSNKIMSSCGSADNKPVSRDATIVQCQLWNTTYRTNFSWENGVQTVDVSQEEDHGPIGEQFSIAGVAPLYTLAANGSAIYPTPDEPWSYNVSVIQGYAYQAVMDAFGQLLVGSISNSRASQGALVISNTSIMNTVLGDVQEFEFLRVYGDNGDVQNSNFKQAAILSNATWDGAWINSTAAQNSLNLRDALEQLFQNITISLTSSPLLQANLSSPYAPSAVPVTFTPYRSVYTYSAMTLWLAYGIALLLCTIAVGIGLVSVFRGGASYSNSFSTVMRTTSHAVLSRQIEAADAAGQNPLPKHLAGATIRFLGEDGRELGEANEKVGPRSRFSSAREESSDSRLL